jgi:hypothetical protein
MKTQLVRLLVASLAFLAVNVSATVHYVDLNSPNPVSPYTGWATAATNIQDAINYSGFSDTILVTNGIYQYGGSSYSGSNRVYANNSQTIQSVNGPAFTTIVGYQVPGTTNGANAVRCVYLQKGTTLSGFTLTNGATQDFDYGGGVKCATTSCLVTNCVITGNAAYDGGGGAYDGTLVNCILTGNTAVAPSVGSGGGAYDSLLFNCVVARNFAEYICGAALSCTLVNCTVVGNAAAAYDGSLDSCTVKNSIVYYNFSYYTNADTGGGGYFTNCCTSFAVTVGGADDFTNPPAFVNLAGGDFHLSAASPCINAGDNSFITNSTDLDGNPRIVAGTVDIGAYEFQSPVHYVSVSNSAPVSPFANWVTAATNIQDAIDAASAGDFIVVSDGVYNTGGRAVYGVATNRVTVDRAVTVQSVNGPTATVIKGDYTPPTRGGPNSRCVYLTNGAAIIGFTLANGGTAFSTNTLLEASGGAVWCESSAGVVSNCVLTANTAAAYGGGAFQGTLYDCILTNNFANQGGGACSNILVNCTLIRNFAVFQNLNSGGGALYSTLSNCLVVANSCNGGGGGANFSALTSCVVSNNTGNDGGGVSVGVIDNCLISSNRSFNLGGGAYSNTLINCVVKNNLAENGGGAYRSVLDNCTVVGNTASGDGGGLNGGGATNCIVYYNSAPSGSNFQSAVLNYCDTMPLPDGFGNITNEPAFLDLVNGDFHLQSNSPCINSGNNTYVTTTTDFDGNLRIVGGTVDIGAYEYQTPTSIISYAWLQQYGLPITTNIDTADLDGTGMSVYQDWIAGLNPTNALSVLAMLSPAPTNSPAGLIVSWQSVSNITYFLQSSTNLAAQPAFSTIQSNIVGQAGTTSYMDTNAVGSGPYFYRVGVQ